MKKMPTLFKRDFHGNPSLVTEDYNLPDAEWVLNGEGIATYKIDGTCCLIKDGQLFKRYELKKGKTIPEGFLFIPAQEPDPNTGDVPGWTPVTDQDKWHQEGLRNLLAQELSRLTEYERTELERVGTDPIAVLKNGTYELVGPKVQSNPEGLADHRLIPHNSNSLVIMPAGFDVPRTFYALKQWFENEYSRGHFIEGIVFWRDHSDQNCDKVKIKAKDFGVLKKNYEGALR